MRRIEIRDGYREWREVARGLLAAGVPPAGAEWVVPGESQGDLGLGGGSSREAVGTAVRVPRVPKRFLELAEMVADHRAPGRWDLLYRVLWRLTHGEPGLMQIAVDAEVAELLRMERAVRRSAHKMKAFVRFRELGETYVAWFEPEHRVLARVAPFFVERFASMRWAILTPDGCALWDTRALRLTPPVPRHSVPDHDAVEALWKTYYAHTFNPARVRTRAMRAEMPVRYWTHLPEAELIQRLVRDAPSRVRQMLRATGEVRAPRRVFRSPAEKRAAQRGDTTVPLREDRRNGD